MASLGQLIVVAGLAFLVLAAQDHGRGGPAGGVAIGAGAVAAAAPPAPEVVVSMSQHPPRARISNKRLLLIPRSGPSDKWNYVVDHEKPESGSGRRRTRATDGRRLRSSP